MVTAEHGKQGILGKKWHEQGRMDTVTSTELEQAAGNSALEDRKKLRVSVQEVTGGTLAQ